jgi:hypothetical protein
MFNKAKPKIYFIILIALAFNAFLLFFCLPASAAPTADDIQFRPQISFGPEMDIKDLPDYIKAAYNFSTAAIVVLCIVMVLIGGVQWIISAGDSGKIGKAQDRIMKALTGLAIALFATVMLYQINPNLLTFSPLKLTPINVTICCDVSGGPQWKPEAECPVGKTLAPVQCLESPGGGGSPTPPLTATCASLITKTTCESNTTCEWVPMPTAVGTAIETNGNCKVKTTSACTSFITKTTCEADTTCKWTPNPGVAGLDIETKGTCASKTPSTGDPLDLACAQKNKKGACYLTSGCVWSSKFCGLNPSLTSMPASYKCGEFLTESDCNTDSTNCKWNSGYTCTSQNILTTNDNASGLRCASRPSESCTTYHCFWSTVTGHCERAVDLGQPCVHAGTDNQSSETCGDLAYCYLEGKVIGDDGVCKLLLTPGQKCFGLGGQVAFGVTTACDRCCAADKCTTRVFVVGGQCKND